ncbi:MAG: sugar phosphate isomerase/epimerase family protein [Planctomycetota bacterium]|nr:sugar phosphate isomerase/epimerase family protein [Planctomycetota bacterium]
MASVTNRRHFLKTSLVAASAGLVLPLNRIAAADAAKPLFKISLAQWSLHRALHSGKLNNLDFAETAKNDFGIDAIEYVNSFFGDKAKDMKYLTDLKGRADDLGVKSLLIMCDGEGELGNSNAAKRTTAVENHYRWVDAAKFLGCHSIRVNARSDESLSAEEQGKLAADGLRRLSEYAAPQEINVIVENHGSLSSNGAWLAKVMKTVNLPNCGTLPDFGNFVIGPNNVYDRYQGVRELMPFAKGVSAKSYDFDAKGNETKIDYRKMMKIVLDAGYHGYVGIEYEGKTTPEPEGIMATKKLLETVRTELAGK